jgi:hypothetical protein
LKVAAGRVRDQADVIELVRANEDQVEGIRRHLTAIHSDYVVQFERLVEQARKQVDR